MSLLEKGCKHTQRLTEPCITRRSSVSRNCSPLHCLLERERVFRKCM